MDRRLGAYQHLLMQIIQREFKKGRRVLPIKDLPSFSATNRNVGRLGALEGLRMRDLITIDVDTISITEKGMNYDGQ